MIFKVVDWELLKRFRDLFPKSEYFRDENITLNFNVKGKEIDVFFTKKKKRKRKTLKVPLIVTDGLIFGTYYAFIFPSALITHNYHHFTHTLSKNEICLHFSHTLHKRQIS